MSKAISQMLEDFVGKKVLVIGDVMLDKYLSGDVNRISPEAPVPVLDYSETRRSLGGAANVALNLQSLQAKVFLAAVVGDDEAGSTLCGLLQRHAIDASCVIRDRDRITTTKTRVMAGDQHLLRVDREVKKPLTSLELTGLLDDVEELVGREDINLVIFQDYNKGMLSGEVISSLTDLFRRKQVKICVDPKFDNFLTYKNVDIFKPNLLELRASVPFDVKPIKTDLRRAAKFLRDTIGCQIVLITLSDRGIYINSPSEDHLLPVSKRSIVDVCGAGDTVISMAALAYLTGQSIQKIAYWSGLAGTLTCQYPGVTPITREMLLGE